MVAGSITEEVAMAAPAELVWKAIFETCDESSLRNLLSGVIDGVVKVDGDGGPGSRYTLKFSPAVGAAPVLLKCRLAARDNAARAITFDEVAAEGGEVAPAAQLKSQVVQFKVEPAGAGGCVIKIAVESECPDGTPVSLADDQAKLTKLVVHLIKKVEGKIVPSPQCA